MIPCFKPNIAECLREGWFWFFYREGNQGHQHKKFRPDEFHGWSEDEPKDGLNATLFDHGLWISASHDTVSECLCEKGNGNLLKNR